jgi:hypothetical protein
MVVCFVSQLTVLVHRFVLYKDSYKAKVDVKLVHGWDRVSDKDASGTITAYFPEVCLFMDYFKFN